MTAINRGQHVGRIVSRTEKLSPKTYVYTVLLEDNTTTSVAERTNLTRNINDEYVVQLYDDPFYNVFVEKK
jgi:hypothetical protein